MVLHHPDCKSVLLELQKVEDEEPQIQLLPRSERVARKVAAIQTKFLRRMADPEEEEMVDGPVVEDVKMEAFDEKIHARPMTMRLMLHAYPQVRYTAPPLECLCWGCEPLFAEDNLIQEEVENTRENFDAVRGVMKRSGMTARWRYLSVQQNKSPLLRRPRPCWMSCVHRRLRFWVASGYARLCFYRKSFNILTRID